MNSKLGLCDAGFNWSRKSGNGAVRNDLPIIKIDNENVWNLGNVFFSTKSFESPKIERHLEITSGIIFYLSFY